MKRLVVAAAVAATLAAPASAAAKPKYFFVGHTIRTNVTKSTCDVLPRGKTIETTTTVRFKEQRGYVGGNMTTSGYEEQQYDLKTEGNAASQAFTGPKVRKEFDPEKSKAKSFITTRGRTATFKYAGISTTRYSKVRLTLPKRNREVTESFEEGPLSFPYTDDSGDRCVHESSTTVSGGITIQRIE
jgi:hypothetical protein